MPRTLLMSSDLFTRINPDKSKNGRSSLPIFKPEIEQQLADLTQKPYAIYGVFIPVKTGLPNKRENCLLRFQQDCDITEDILYWHRAAANRDVLFAVRFANRDAAIIKLTFPDAVVYDKLEPR